MGRVRSGPQRGARCANGACPEATYTELSDQTSGQHQPVFARMTIPMKTLALAAEGVRELRYWSTSHLSPDARDPFSSEELISMSRFAYSIGEQEERLARRKAKGPGGE